MPTRRQNRVELARKWISELPKANGAWTVTPATISELTDLTEDVETRQAALEANNSDVNRTRVKEADAAMTKFMRSTHRRSFFSPPMEPSDYVRIGLKPPDTIITSQPVPTSVPEIEAITSVIRQIGLRIRDFGSKSWGKPDHVHSIELAWEIRDDRPDTVEEMPNVEVETKSPIVLKFEDTQRGKRVYFAARWMNNTAKGGPWSDIESAFVP
jgi:hypothetical protein